MPTKRFTGAAAVRRSGVSAGTIDSSSGNASVTPAPRRNVRRAMCFLATNISGSLTAHYEPQRPSHSAANLIGRDRPIVRLHPHLKLRTLHDAHDHRREPVVLAGGVADEGSNDGH